MAAKDFYDFEEENDLYGVDDYFEHEMFSPYPTDRNARELHKNPIPLQGWMIEKIAKTLNPLLNRIIEKSRPTKDSEDISGNLGNNLMTWRRNIYNNLENLKTIQAEGDRGETTIYSTAEKEYTDRVNSINILTEEIKNAKALKRSSIKAVKTEAQDFTDSVYNLPGLEPDIEKKWWQVFKKKTDLQKDLESTEKSSIKEGKKDAKTEFKKTKALLSNYIKYLTEGMPAEITINDIEPDYRKYFNNNNVRDSRDQLKGRLEGEVDRESEVAKEDRFDPYRDFKISMDGNVPDIYFDFLGVKSIDDIMPLFAPKAKDNIIDKSKGTKAEDNPYVKLLKLDEELPDAKTLNSIIDKEFSGTTKVADGASNTDVAKHLFKLGTDKRTQLLNYYRQKQFQLLTTGSTQMGTEFIIQEKLNEQKMKDVRKKWDEQQNKEVKDDLNTLYEKNFKLYADERNWKDNNKDKMRVNPDQSQSGFNEEGVATRRTAQDFGNWLKSFPPEGLKWEKNEFLPIKPKPVQSMNNENFKEEDDEWNKLSEKAKKWTVKLEMIDRGTTSISGWEIDAIKQEVLTNLSLTTINPQKWTSKKSYGIDEVTEKLNAGGEFMSGETSTNHTSRDNMTGAIQDKFGSMGIYRSTESKRNPDYDEKSGYTNPLDDSTYIKGIDQNILPNQDQATYEKEKGTAKSDKPTEVGEKINWIINYDVKAYQAKKL